ncbi:MJ0042-type zinc finger domain-containing protein [uncultured Phenylobacterium sp.]|uniref:MJ0042-type zinc finger domain-containing protein n=1 Tax=uncultured Phenylobacterium sp. TaxID=349273 RepID=UPI0025D53003|nr:MJ0042-type zinc finger domain-containing protein [uncultured Phenylobacterium sp.]
MILTCPECATSYFVDDDRIPAAGRSVKCSSCGNRWRALPESAEEAESEPVEPAPSAELAEPLPAPEPGDTTLAAGSDDLEFVPAAASPKPKNEPKTKGGSRRLAIGVTVLGLLAVSLSAVVALRQQVAGLIPATAPLFAAIGLPVNTLGLTFEGVAWKPTFLAGRPVMAVTGAIRNVSKAPIDAPAVRVSLLGDEKAVLAVYDLSVTNARVPPGGVRYFAWNLPDPPLGADNLEIGFNRTAKGHGADAHAPQAAESHDPAPVEAQALPPGSPDALPHHE